jgi:hypothetical protein
MQKELLNKVIGLFESPEKWNSFLELTNQIPAIKYQYFQKVKQPLQKYFNENAVEGWICEPWGDPNFDMKWYLQDFGKESLALAIGWKFQFVLFLGNQNKFDTYKIDELLKGKYSPIISAFDRVDRQFEPQFKIVESGNYIFDSPYDGHFDENTLSWYAGNQTEKFVKQIIDKVERFRKDERLTNMLYEINQLSMIKSE